MKEQIEKIAAEISTIDYCQHLAYDKCKTKHCFECEAEALYNAGFSKQEWISVEDRMPPALGKVLVYSPILGVYMTCYTAYSPRFAEESVTHWMPLPEPPEMKGGE